MNEFLKMADVFSGVVKPNTIDGDALNNMVSDYPTGTHFHLEDDKHWIAITESHMAYAAHAINHHDALVDEVQQLRQLVKEKDERIDALERGIIDTQRLINDGVNLCANAAKPVGVSNRLPDSLLVLLTTTSVTTLFLLSFSLMGWL